MAIHTKFSSIKAHKFFIITSKPKRKMPSQAESQVHTERDHRPYDFSPIPQDVAGDLESNLGSNDLGNDGSRRRLETCDIVLLSVAFVEGLFLVYMLLNWAFGPHDSMIHAESFSVSKFNVSDSHLITVIESNLTFGCKDCDYEFVLDKINGTIFYKDDDTALSSVSVEPISLGNKELKTLQVKFAAYIREKEYPLMMQQPVLKQILEDDLRNGTTHLTLNIIYHIHRKKWGIPFYGGSSNCWDLAVKFSAASGVGRLIGSSEKEC